MRPHRIIPALLALALLLGWTADALAKDVHIHFFVVPQKADDGTAFVKQFVELKKGLLEIAGGYTMLGPSEGGSMGPQGTIKRQENVSFLVAADKDVSARLADLIRTAFKEKTPFILVWRGAWPGR